MSMTGLFTLDTLDDQALDSLPYGVVRLDAGGRVVRFNQTEAQRSGIQRWRALGRDYVKDIAGAHSDLARRVADLAPGECDRFEHTFRGFHREDHATVEVARADDGRVWLRIMPSL